MVKQKINKPVLYNPTHIQKAISYITARQVNLSPHKFVKIQNEYSM